MQLEALESSSSDDEDGADNSGAIAAIMAEISSTQDEISDCRQQDAELRSQEMEADAELRQVEMEEQETLSDIQDSAARTNQNIALISSFGGDYANVSAQASGSFQHNLGQLSQAAQILGGSVAMGAAGAGGRGAGRVSRGNAGQADGSGRNFYEAANNQRKSGNSSSGAMGAKGSAGTSGIRKAPDLYSESALEEERPSKKAGGFGKKVSNLKQNIANAFNLGGAVKEFSGCIAVKRADQQDCWDIPGSGFEAYDDFRNNHENYERVTYDTPHMETASADNIEGISNIRTADVEHPEIFWGRDSGKTMQDFMDIAQHIPEVSQQLKSGRSLDDLMMDDRLGKCAAIYYANAPTVYKGDGFYEFSGNGRHRILAARALGLSIPVVVAGEIFKKKKTTFGEKANAFRERIKVDPSTLSTPSPSDGKIDHGPRDPREREYRQKQGGMGRRSKATNSIDALSAYMNSRNYGKDDFAIYSKDPVWRILHRAAYPDYEIPPLSKNEAVVLLQQYMYSHNYGKEDFSIYSRDPIWQELQRYIAPDGIPVFTRPERKTASKQYNDIVSTLTAYNIEYRTVAPYGKQRSSEEIVARLSGGDKTKGSCSSLAFAYAGNKAGYDILDYRGGQSCDFFSSNDAIIKIAKMPGVHSEIVYGKDDIGCANSLLSQMISGKEYYLAVGQHASIVRCRNGHYEYLELQSGKPSENKWTPLSDQIFRNRFGCESNNLYEYPNILIDVDSLSNNHEFVDLLGYINTAETGQRKGVTGHVR